MPSNNSLYKFAHSPVSVHVVFPVPASLLLFREIHGGKNERLEQTEFTGRNSFQIHIWTSPVLYGKEIEFIPSILTNLGGSPRNRKG